MAKTQFNDFEDEALQGLPWRAQVLYLRGIRKWMNYETGIAGKPSGKIISTQMLREITETRPAHQSKEQVKQLTRNEIRAAIKMLIRAGLIQVSQQSSRENGYIFKCVLASTRQSVNFHSNPTATQRQQPNNIVNFQQDRRQQQPTKNREKTPTTTNNGYTDITHTIGPADFEKFQVTQRHRDYAHIHGLPRPDDHVLNFIHTSLSNGKQTKNIDSAFYKFLIDQRVIDSERQTRNENHRRMYSNSNTEQKYDAAQATIDELEQLYNSGQL